MHTVLLYEGVTESKHCSDNDSKGILNGMKLEGLLLPSTESVQ